MCIPVQWDDDDFYISTTLADAQRGHHTEQEHGSSYFDLSVTRRMGEAPELEGALLFLASAASSYVNGIVLPVDGGNYLRGM